MGQEINLNESGNTLRVIKLKHYLPKLMRCDKIVLRGKSIAAYVNVKKKKYIKSTIQLHNLRNYKNEDKLSQS
jgi:hypothetical protein